MLEFILDVVIDAIIDSAKLIPFLFITYLIMEYLEHKTSNKHKEKMKTAGKMGPVIGGILGAFPQCGFSVSATNLYVGRVISLGTLIAVYLSTSDEMIPVFLSESVSIITIFQVLLIKVFIGIVIGIFIDLISKPKDEEYAIHDICENDHCHCEHGIVKSSIKHTVNITIFIVLMNIILGVIFELVGEDNISNLLMNQTILGPIIICLIGLIPNCGASVIIAEMYISGIIGSGTLIAGLLVGAGVGLLVLFKENHNIKENLKIIFILYSIGLICGIILEKIGFNL